MEPQSQECVTSGPPAEVPNDPGYGYTCKHKSVEKPKSCVQFSLQSHRGLISCSEEQHRTPTTEDYK